MAGGPKDTVIEVNGHYRQKLASEAAKAKFLRDECPAFDRFRTLLENPIGDNSLQGEIQNEGDHFCASRQLADHNDN